MNVSFYPTPSSTLAILWFNEKNPSEPIVLQVAGWIRQKLVRYDATSGETLPSPRAVAPEYRFVAAIYQGAEAVPAGCEEQIWMITEMNSIPVPDVCLAAYNEWIDGKAKMKAIREKIEANRKSA